MKLGASSLAIVVILTLAVRAYAHEPLAPLPPETDRFLNELSLANAIDASSIVTWIHDRFETNTKKDPYRQFFDEDVLGTNDSQSATGPHRLVYIKGNSFFTLFKDGEMEMAADTRSERGLLPYVVQAKTGKLEATPAKQCAQCHSSEFTFIWSLDIAHVFTHHKAPLPEPLNKVQKFLSSGNIGFLLVRRAARNLFRKIVERHPDRFKKHSVLLLRLLMGCDVPEADWNALQDEIKKTDPSLVTRWSTVFSEWDASVAKKSAEYATNPKESYEKEGASFPSKASALRPLMLIHYLGVPPESIYLFRPLEEKKPVLDSMENFFQLEEPEPAFRPRWGPLGAYAGGNQDVRGFLAAHLAEKVFPADKITYPLAEDEKRFADKGAPFIRKRAEGESDKSDKRANLRLETERYSLSSLFHIYEIYTDFYHDSGKDKQKMCEQWTPANADFSFLLAPPEAAKSSTPPAHAVKK